MQKQNLAAQILLLHLVHYNLTGCYSDNIEFNAALYRKLERLGKGFKKNTEIKLPEKKSWQNWTKPDGLTSTISANGITWMLESIKDLLKQNIDTIEQFISYWKDEHLIQVYDGKRPPFDHSDIQVIRTWVSEIIASKRIVRHDLNNIIVTPETSQQTVEGATALQHYITSPQPIHPCDSYINHFFIDTRSSEYKSNPRLYLEKYLSNFESYISPTELVGRLNGINRDGDKFIELFEYQIRDITLKYRREERKYDEYIDHIINHGNSSPFLIIGEAGGGKSSLCYMIFQKVIRSYYLGKNYDDKLLPLYIPVYMFKNIADLTDPYFFSTLYKDLAKTGIKEVVYDMIKQGRIFIILDGLDEIDFRLLQSFGHEGNSETPETEDFRPVSILKDTYKGCPMLVTCRRHFHETYRKAMNRIGFEQLFIKPLEWGQIQAYVKKRLSGEKANTALKLIAKTDLFKLAPTVVLLEMIVTCIAKDSGFRFTGSTDITKKDIYKALVQEWSEDQAARIEKIVDRSAEGEKSEMTMRYLMIVSLAMFYYGQDGVLIISAERIMTYMQKYHPDQTRMAGYADDLRNIFSHLGYSKLNKEKDESYAFNHKTILEYLVAEAVILGLIGDLKILTENIRRGIFVMFSRPLDKQDDNEIIQFIKDLVEEKSSTEQELINYRLMEIIDEKYNDDSISDFTLFEQITIRNNALKILAHINQMNLSCNETAIPKHFNRDVVKYQQYIGLMAGKDFTEIKLGDCNLTDRDLSHSNLSGALLKGVNLSGTNLYRANFSKANLTGAYLGDCHSMWDIKYSKVKNSLLIDCGDGNLILTDLNRQYRVSKESFVDRAIWTIGLAYIHGNEYAIAGQYSDTISIYNITSGLQKLSLRILFSIKIYTVRYHELLDVLFYAGSSGNIHYISNFSGILSQQRVEIYLAESQNRSFHHLNYDVTDAYIKKDHKDIIFGIVFSSCQQYLITCSHDQSVKLWKIDELIGNSRHANDNVSHLSETVTDNKASVRKIVSVNFNDMDYYVAGTEKGDLIIGEHVVDNLIPLFNVKNIQTDWILDIATFKQEDTLFLVTVSGDFSVCIWDFSELLEWKWKCEPVFMAKYSSSLLSVTTNATDKKAATHIYIGSYDGSIIGKEIKQLLATQLERDDNDRILPFLWTRSDVLVEIQKLPEAFISDATNLNRTGIIGLNQGRMLALDQRGALNDTTAASSECASDCMKLQEEINQLNWEIRNFLVNRLAIKNTYANSLSVFIEKAAEYNDRFYAIGTQIEILLSKFNSEVQKSVIIEAYQGLTSVKVTIASALMVLYWLDNNTWRVTRQAKLEQSLYAQLKQIDYKHINTVKRSKTRVIFEETVERIKDVLEDYFTDNMPEALFEFVYEDYISNEKLRAICDFLAGEETDKQIPAESRDLKAIGITNLWNEMSNNFWTGNSRIAKIYFDSFVNRIYRCCLDTQFFLVGHITDFIKKALLGSSKRTITYLDMATGFNGTIVHEVYKRLSPKQRQRVTFLASDSSPKIVSMLEEYFQSNGINIQVSVQDLLTVDGVKNDSIDIISQNLGAHHLSKIHQDRMYRKFVALLRTGGFLAIGDVSQQSIKVLAGLPDDIGAPEYPYDCRKLKLPELKPLAGEAFPRLGKDEGFYTCQTYMVKK